MKNANYNLENFIPFEQKHRLELFEQRHYVFQDRLLLVGQREGNKYHYNTAATGKSLLTFTDMLTFTDSNKPKYDVVDLTHRNNIRQNEYVVNFITGLPVNFNIFSKLDINKEIFIHPASGTSFMSILCIGDITIQANPKSTNPEAYRLYKNNVVKELKETNLKKVLDDYMITNGFTVEDIIPDSVIDKSTRFDCSTVCDKTEAIVWYSEENNRFYIQADAVLGIYEKCYSIEAKYDNGIAYMCIESDFFYLNSNSNDISYISLNTEYSQPARDKYVVLDDNRGINILDKPCSKFLRRDYNLLIYKNNSININDITATIEHTDSISVVTSSNLEIISTFDNRNLIMPIKKLDNGKEVDLYIIADDNGFYMYLYPGQDHTDKDTLTIPNYIKYNRKKSNVFVHNGLICINNENKTFKTIKSDDFILDSIEVLGPDTFKITDREGNDYTSTTEGLIKYSIEDQLKDIIEIMLEQFRF